MVELTKRQERILTKRLKAKEVSDKKIQAAKKKAEADKTYKVHVRADDKTTKIVIVKAKSRGAAAAKAGKGAIRAFEVPETYKLPEAKPKKPGK